MSQEEIVGQMVHRVYKIVILSQNIFQQVGQLKLPHIQAQLEQLTLIDPGDVDADNYLQIALAYLVQFNQLVSSLLSVVQTTNSDIFEVSRLIDPKIFNYKLIKHQRDAQIVVMQTVEFMFLALVNILGWETGANLTDSAVGDTLRSISEGPSKKARSDGDKKGKKK